MTAVVSAEFLAFVVRIKRSLKVGETFAQDCILVTPFGKVVVVYVMLAANFVCVFGAQRRPVV
jgi:hypothetical protein